MPEQESARETGKPPGSQPPSPRRPAKAKPNPLERAGLILLGSATALLVLLVLWRALPYYFAPLEARPHLPADATFRPSRSWGHGLGIAGGLILAATLLYPLRKIWKRLRKAGRIAAWLRYHIWCGLAGPVLVTLHTAFKFGGLVAVSYWSMVAVMISGVIGRYLYAQIPRSIAGHELSERELAERDAALQADLPPTWDKIPSYWPRSKGSPAFRVSPGRGDSGLLALSVGNDLARGWRVHRLAGHLRARGQYSEALIREITSIARRRAVLRRRVCSAPPVAGAVPPLAHHAPALRLCHVRDRDCPCDGRPASGLYMETTVNGMPGGARAHPGTRISALLCLTLGMICLAPGTVRAQFSPGPLSRAHQGLEGTKACTRCHELGVGKGPSDTRCLECHETLRDRLAAGRGFHARGERGAGLSLDATRSTTAGTTTSSDWIAPTLTMLRPATRSRAGIPASPARSATPRDEASWGCEGVCRACHADVHGGRLGTDCRRCHDENAWKPAPGFDHGRTRYPLRGAHVSVSCEKCHPEGRFSGLRFDDCQACHPSPHTAAFAPGKSCSSCHDPAGWARRAGAAFDHARTRFPLEGGHAKVACAACHKGGRYKSLGGAVCEACHPDPHQGQFRAGLSAGCPPATRSPAGSRRLASTTRRPATRWPAPTSG